MPRGGKREGAGRPLTGRKKIVCRVEVLLTEDQLGQLDQLAKQLKLSRGATIRHLLRHRRKLAK